MPSVEMSPEDEATLTRMRRDVIGHGSTFSGAYGEKLMVYADWTASGRALRSVESKIRRDVLPLYANTHTSTSTTGAQSSCFRQEARQVVAQCVNARVSYSDKHSDVVIFAGSGSTGAVDRLARALGAHVPLPRGAPRRARPVVFVGPHEHHSNLLPWRESCAIVVTIPEDSRTGGPCVRALASALARYRHHPTLIGSFSAASNVTGVLADVNAITETLHLHGALAFWDYAAAAPYVEMDMNPVVFDPKTKKLNPNVYKDAMFVSPHKLPGGPGSPGVLVAKRSLFQNDVPSEPGGGTVFFVTGADHRYLSNRVEREEGGTQDIVGSARAGLAFQVKAAVGAGLIARAERRLRDTLFGSLAANPRIVLLGPRTWKEEEEEEEDGDGDGDGASAGKSGKIGRLPIVSFLVRAPAVGTRWERGGAGPTSRFLHHSFVCAVLNDVFGVQARGGCACAGPYAHSLLGIDEAASAAVEAHLLDKAEVLRPGFARVSLPYFASAREIEYVARAIHAVADHAWRLLPMYRVDAKTGEWRHVSRARSFPERRWLAHMKFPRDGGDGTSGDGTSRDGTSGDGTSGSVLDVGNDVSDDDVPSEESIAARLDEQLATGLRVLETCGVHPSNASSTARVRGGKNGNNVVDDDGNGNGGEQRRLRVPKPEGGLAADERAMLAGGMDDDDDGDARLAYGDDGNGDDGDVQPVGAHHGSSAERGDAIRWFMFPSEASRLLENAVQSYSAGGILPLDHLPEVRGVAGAMRPPGVEDLDPRGGPSHSSGGSSGSRAGARAESRKHPLRVTERTENVRGGLIQKRAAPLCVGDPREPTDGEPTEGEPADGEPTDGRGAGESDKENVEEERVVELEAEAEAELEPKAEPEAEAELESGVSTAVATVASSDAPKSKRQSKKLAKPPAKILKPLNQALNDFDMIKEGDRVLLGLSGGKDSLAMLHLLLYVKSRFPPGYFTLACATVDPGTEAFNPRPLIPYVRSLGVEYHYLDEKIMAMAERHMTGDSICAFCARMKRGALYSCCRAHGYNKLVLAQHLDDCVESFLMSTMYNGAVRTMKAKYVIDEGDVEVIRPAVYLREKSLRDFSYDAGLPVINENCPACFEAPKERNHIKKLLAREESVFPSLYSSMRNALTPLFDPAAVDVLTMIRENIDRRNGWNARRVAQRLEAVRQGKCEKGRKDIAAEEHEKTWGENEGDLPEGVDVGVDLSRASEAQLLEELNRRRRERVRKTGGKEGATVGSRLNDVELDADLTEKQMFCTADGCAREP